MQRDLAVMKDEVRNLKMESGSTLCSEAGTGVGLGASGTLARPPVLASWFNEIVIPRKVEFKGWIKDYTRSSFQGITDEEVMVFIVDLQKIMPGQFHQYVDRDQSRKEQGNWTTRTTVNMWFKNETNLASMTGVLKVAKEELKEKCNKIRDQEVSARPGSESPKEILCESARPVLQGTESSERR